MTARVTNTGSRAGAEVAQLYIGAPTGANEPVRQLKAYTKVTLKPGTTHSLPRGAVFLGSFPLDFVGGSVSECRVEPDLIVT